MRINKNVWVCSDCHGVLGPEDENYKHYLATLERNPHDIDPVMYANPTDFCDDELVLREFFCPHCGHLGATEIARADDPPLWDMIINPHSKSPATA